MARARVVPPRGYSLLEVLVAAGLALLLTGAVVRLLVAGGRLFAYGQARADLQAAGLAALGQLSRELRESAAVTITTWSGTSARADSALSCRPVARGGSLSPYLPGPQWVIALRDTQRRALVRMSAPAGGGLKLGDGQLLTLLNTPARDERVLAPWVRRFSVTPGPYTVALRLELSQPLGTSRTVDQAVEATVALRNRL